MTRGRAGGVRRGGMAAAAVPAVLLAAALAPAGAAAGASDDGFALSRPEEHLWRWTTAEHRTWARRRPHRRARVVARVHRRTPEGTAEVLPAVRRRSVAGRLWVEVRLPVLPNNTTGWVPRSRLGGYREVRTRLIVDTRRASVRLEQRGRTVFRARAGVGLPRWPTPRGHFIVRNRLAGFDDPRYGVLAFGTSARSAVLTDWPGGGFVGIHGTDRPGLLPGRVSHGCVRLRNADMLRLDRRMPVGTMVTVR